jgi:NADH-ubiquinone oxidoreductase chain 2
MLIYSIIFILISIAVNNRRDLSIYYNRLIIIILLYSQILIYLNINDLKTGIILFNGLFFLENYNLIFIYLILIISMFIVLLISFYPRKINNINNYTKILEKFIFNKNIEQFRIIEYSLILLFCISGTIFLLCSYDIMSVFLAIELQSYSLYLISAIYRNSEYSVAASLMYFLLGSLASCIILLGLSLIYINIGSTSIENIFIINSIFWSDYNIETYGNIATQYFYVQIALVIMSIGFLFKISAAPFHFWSPDVYNAVPTIVTIFIAIIPKISILLLLYNIKNFTVFEYSSWSSNFMLSAILSLIIGSVLGLTQYKIKRLYAYSTISHLGFILLALSINTIESTKAFFFYLIQYSVSNLNLFIILISIGYTMYIYSTNNNIKDYTNSPIQYIYQLKGYFYINPIISISFIITLFSFVGIPPMVGFFAKQMVLNVALDQGFVFISVIAILTSVISAVYYLMIVKNLFFKDSEISNIVTQYNINKTDISISGYYSLIISLLTLLILMYMSFDQELVFLISCNI